MSTDTNYKCQFSRLAHILKKGARTTEAHNTQHAHNLLTKLTTIAVESRYHPKNTSLVPCC